VLRVLMIAMLVLGVAQAGGVIPVGADPCDESRCPDSGKQCPPNCPTCTCAAAPIASLPQAPVTIVAPIRAPERVASVEPRPYLPSPDPREILHVPRHSV